MFAFNLEIIGKGFYYLNVKSPFEKIQKTKTFF